MLITGEHRLCIGKKDENHLIFDALFNISSGLVS